MTNFASDMRYCWYHRLRWHHLSTTFLQTTSQRIIYHIACQQHSLIATDMVPEYKACVTKKACVPEQVRLTEQSAPSMEMHGPVGDRWPRLRHRYISARDLLDALRHSPARKSTSRKLDINKKKHLQLQRTMRPKPQTRRIIGILGIYRRHTRHSPRIHTQR